MKGTFAPISRATTIAISGALCITPIVSAASASAVTPAPSASSETMTLTPAQRHARIVKLKQQRVLHFAFSKRHARYVAGASGPYAFDCSGFALWVYRKALGKHLPHYSGSQMRVTQRVSRRHLQPGDLMFYGRAGSQHVAIYIGRGKQIGANNPSAGIRIESINAPWWRGIYAGAGRVIR